MKPTMNHGIERRKELDPLKELAKAVITRACLDSLGHITNSSYCGKAEKSILIDTAKNFFNPRIKSFRLWCDIAGGEPEYIKDLHSDLTYHYNCGRLKNFNTRVVIETLLKKL
jgi:hypothetical protein|tara:strand:+ start:303 stop:641 length:339 start_codon:yes stop_codon:yes gene_type:complete